MPHIIVKLYPGKSEEAKARLAGQIVSAVVTTLDCGEQSVSVAMQEVKPEDWGETVYKPDIADNWESLYKQPGYNPFE